MKAPKLHLILFAISCLLLTGMKCKKEIREPEPQLPSETQIGANTFGCLVNGRVFVPQGSFSHAKINASIQFNILSLGARNSETGESLSFGIRNVINENSYEFTSDNTATYFLMSQQFDAVDGKITITKYDKINNIISGRFSFNAKNKETGKLVSITDGRFDVKYTE